MSLVGSHDVVRCLACLASVLQEIVAARVHQHIPHGQDYSLSQQCPEPGNISCPWAGQQDL